MTIGVAIPCYHGHISNLFTLLDSIQLQSVLPDKVVVSCSSTSCDNNKIYSLALEKIDNKVYSFPLELIFIEEKKNAAQNRNIAAAKMDDMDLITFIDADDIMHPQRIEILLLVIKNYNSDIILHNYYNESEISTRYNFEKIEYIIVRENLLVQSWSGCITHSPGHNDLIDKIHHSQVTVKKEIFEKVKFPEEIEYNRKEDSTFCYRVFSLPDIQNAYVQNKLSYYKPSKTGGYKC